MTEETSRRRAHQCHRDGCDSPATHEVHLHIRYGWHHVAVESLKSSIRVCDSRKCRAEAERYMLSEHNKGVISRELAKIGRLSLDWPNAMLEFVPLDEDVWGPANMQRLQQMVPLGTA